MLGVLLLWRRGHAARCDWWGMCGQLVGQLDQERDGGVERVGILEGHGQLRTTFNRRVWLGTGYTSRNVWRTLQYFADQIHVRYLLDSRVHQSPEFAFFSVHICGRGLEGIVDSSRRCSRDSMAYDPPDFGQKSLHTNNALLIPFQLL